MNQSEHNAHGLMNIFTQAVSKTGARLVATEEEALEAYASIVKGKLANGAGDDMQQVELAKTKMELEQVKRELLQYRQYERLHERCTSKVVRCQSVTLGSAADLIDTNYNRIEAYGLERGWLIHSDGKLCASEEGIRDGLVVSVDRASSQRVRFKFTLLGLITLLAQFE